MNVAPVYAAAALVVVALAAASDVRERRIPNSLTLPAVALGLVFHLAFHGREGLLSSLAGAGVGFGLTFPAWPLRWMGAGDVKLMTAVGAWLGWPAALLAVLYSAVAGGALALAAAWSRGAARKAVVGAAGMAGWLLRGRAGGSPETTGIRTPYGLAIAAGTFFALLVRA